MELNCAWKGEMCSEYRKSATASLLNFHVFHRTMSEELASTSTISRRSAFSLETDVELTIWKFSGLRSLSANHEFEGHILLWRS